MGGTLTLLIRYLVEHDLDAAGWRIGALYGVSWSIYFRDPNGYTVELYAD